MFDRKTVRNQEPSPYATKSEFCRIFERDMNSLYMLSFLLTADRVTAEQCFVDGLHTAHERNHVFKGWAESWARRAIIQNAIWMIRPRKATDNARSTPDQKADHARTDRVEIARIVDLPAFERFAFVMSVLERYSDQECSLLLGCTRGDVAEARTRALERMRRSVDPHSRSLGVASNHKPQKDNYASAPPLTAAPGLAASA